MSQSQPIKCKTTTKHDLVTRVFPRFKEVACFYSVFSLANNHGNLFSDWQLSSQLDLVFRYSIEKCSTIGSCDQFGFGDPVVINLELDTRFKIRFLRIQCCISVCMYISYKVTKAISELQVGK